MNARSIRYFNDFKTFIVKNEPHLICQQLKFIIVSDPNLFFLQFIPDRYMYTYFFYFLSGLELRKSRTYLATAPFKVKYYCRKFLNQGNESPKTEV